MNEGAKTGVFWGVALALSLLAMLVAWPRSVQDVTANITGQPLFKDFADATKASKLKIVKYNEKQGVLSPFEVAKNRETGDWTIPSASNYPADAAEQIKKAATLFLNDSIKVLDTIQANPDKHSEYGVKEPNKEKLEVGDEGVGMLVELEDDSGNDLASLIIGKKAKTEGERYVRRPNQDLIYVVKLDVNSLSTTFTDWIEKDLLKLNPMDISKVKLNDHAVEVGLQGPALQLNFTAELEAGEGSNWTLKSLTTYDDNNKPKVTSELPPGKELDTAKLGEMKRALDDLKIVSVRRKPKGLSADLKLENAEQSAIESLARRGFYLDNKNELYSANGEIVVGLKNGVEYFLRFGEIAESTSSGSQEGDEKEADKDAEKKDDGSTGVNRYLLVTAKFDEASIPQPELAEVPQSVADIEKLEAAKEAADKPAEETKPEMKSEDTAKPSEEKPEGEKKDGDKPASADKPKDEPASTEPADKNPGEDKKPGEDKPKEDPKAEEPKEEPKPEPSADEPKSESDNESSGTVTGSGSGAGAEAQEKSEEQGKGEEKPSSEEPKSATAETQDKPATESKPETTQPPSTESKPAAAKAKPKFSELSEDEKKERLEAEQERVKRENQRKLDERKEKIDQAQRVVRELNGRFGDWYYVVPESTYKNLHLDQNQLFKAAQPSTNAPAPGGPGAIPGLPPGFNFPK